MDEMNIAMRRLLEKYMTERIIEMPYTIEDFRREIKQDALKMMTPEERLRGLSTDEVLRAFSPEEIRAYLKKLPKKSVPVKKRGTKSKKSVPSEKSS